MIGNRIISRRTLLIGGVGLGVAAGAAGLAGCASGESPEQTALLLPSAAPLPDRFTRPFAVPPVKRPTGREGGATHYEITQRAATVELLPGLRTEIMGYDGLLPGPTIKARRGERVIVRHRNELTVPTVTHLHGGHTPAASDGYPVDLVLPASGSYGHGHQDHTAGGEITRGVRDYEYPHDQRAATLWYHDHRMDFTGPQVWRGLAGLHLITDDEEEALPLPGGDRDLPLMVMDRSFAADGSLAYPSLDPNLASIPGVIEDYSPGVLGDVILVNGVPWPVLEVDAARYRFRIVNASNARRYQFALNPGPPSGPAFVQVGSDGGLLAAPVEHTDLLAAPAERFDVVIDFSVYPVGTEVTMINRLGVGSTDAVLKFRVVRKAADDSAIPARLSTIEPLRPGPDAPVREWRFIRQRDEGRAHWRINGLDFDPARMDAEPRLGETEIWRFYSDLHHPVHVHLDPFQVIRRGNRVQGPYDAGWKDTVDLRPWETVEVAVRFTDHAGRFVLHCHNLEHEDMMMMAAFRTLG